MVDRARSIYTLNCHFKTSRMITDRIPATTTYLGSILRAVSSSASKYLIRPAAEWKPSPFLFFLGGAMGHVMKNIDINILLIVERLIIRDDVL